MVKLPTYGVHLWLPKAHVEAPISGSMVLAGVLLKLGGYGFYRFIFSVNKFLVFNFGFLASIGLCGGLMRCFICLRQVDIKSYVAYSSVCHMGFAITSIFVFLEIGFFGRFYMFVGHGFCSSCLFYILYLIYKRLHTRSLFIIKGIVVLFPLISFFWFAFSVFNMGVPLTLSFFSEIFIVVGVLAKSFISFLFMGLFLFFAGVYGIYLFVVGNHGEPVFIFTNFLIFEREFLLMFCHIFPLFFLPVFVSFFV
jgi:NADH-ubiquinone oxidoreductase chain 4